MMKIKKIDEMESFRAPSEEEIKGVGRHMRAYYSTNIKQTRVVGVLMAVTGTLMLIGGITNQSLTGAVLGAAALVIAMLALQKTTANKNEIARFETGSFYVLDGLVSDIQISPETPGVESVEFTSLTGQVFDGLFEVRQEELEIGTPLLLVYVPEQERLGERFLWAFTPFMLTEEGALKHR